MRGGSGCSRAFSGVYRPSPTFEEIEDGVRNEPATRREQVRVTVSVLLAAEKPKRVDQMKVQLGTRHGDAQNAAFFFDLFRATRRHVGRYATIRDIKYEHGVPFLSLGGMNSRQNKVVFIKQR